MPVQTHTPTAAPSHGACPTCGHCKCCESKRQFGPYYYPDWYRPWAGTWYPITGDTSGGSITATTGTASNFTLATFQAIGDAAEARMTPEEADRAHAKAEEILRKTGDL